MAALYRNFLKRGFDLLGVAAAAPLALPLMAVVAVMVKLDSPGPALFVQERMAGGRRRGRNFRIYKFRTMSVDKEGERRGFEPGCARRVTRVGRFLRASKLDELPQLWNVLVGDMSIVGPRPEVPRYYACYPERWDKVLSIRPGITDPASVKYRDEEKILASSPDPERTYVEKVLPDKLSLYEAYVDACSFLVDLRVVAETAAAVLRRPQGREAPGGQGS